MKSRNLKISTLVGASALMLGYAQAQAQTQFAFSFTGAPNAPYYIGGTVAGIITLNASQNAATSIVLTSLPAGDSAQLALDWVTSPNATVQVNSFAVTGGNISSVEFDSDYFNTLPYGQLSLGYEDYEGGPAGELYNPGQFAGITFTPLPTPEPATLALTALGAGALLKFRRRK